MKRSTILTWSIVVTTLTALLVSYVTPHHTVTAAPAISNPILFVTQVPVPDDFLTIGATFGNHQSDIKKVGRGGDLWIRYPNGDLKNLTEAAGFGTTGFQGEDAIGVRQPAVYWDGTKAVFSMVVGAPAERYDRTEFYWQLYEISGLGQNDTPVITKIPNQPEDYNNISPIYGTDDRIIFTSDRPRNGQRHLYPQLDEYEEAPTNTGLWSLNPATSDLILLDHSPSGDFTPIVDSFGRIIFTRWDHLQRDQLADADALESGDCQYCTFNYASEAANAEILNDNTEIFPEPRKSRTDLLDGTNMVGHRFNHFFPWQMHEDGTELETLNHIGRHELHSYINEAITDDDNVVSFYNVSNEFNKNRIENMFHIRESPQTPGLYFGTNAPEFFTHSAGQLFSLNGSLDVHGDEMAVTYITHPDTADTDNSPSADHSGLYRNPLPLANGTLIAVHTPETREDDNIGSTKFPESRYNFRLKTIVQNGDYWIADQSLTGGITKDISYWNPDQEITYSGQLWELDPVEVAARPRPNRLTALLPSPEQKVIQDEGVNMAHLKSYLVQNDLALIVSRNVTSRDAVDRQQPYNLRIAGTDTQTIGASGKVYDIAYLQLLQADQIRGLTFGNQAPRPGRRVLAQLMADPYAANPPISAGPESSVKLGTDGSMAAFVPAQRAMTWQLTDTDGNPVVRERYWLTFQPGEIRVCASCHGLNDHDQIGKGKPENEPEALRDLLKHWQENYNIEPSLFLPLVVK